MPIHDTFRMQLRPNPNTDTLLLILLYYIIILCWREHIHQLVISIVFNLESFLFQESTLGLLLVLVYRTVLLMLGILLHLLVNILNIIYHFLVYRGLYRYLILCTFHYWYIIMIIIVLNVFIIIIILVASPDLLIIWFENHRVICLCWLIDLVLLWFQLFQLINDFPWLFLIVKSRWEVVNEGELYLGLVLSRYQVAVIIILSEISISNTTTSATNDACVATVGSIIIVIDKLVSCLIQLEWLYVVALVPLLQLPIDLDRRLAAVSGLTFLHVLLQSGVEWEVTAGGQILLIIDMAEGCIGDTCFLPFSVNKLFVYIEVLVCYLRRDGVLFHFLDDLWFNVPHE